MTEGSFFAELRRRNVYKVAITYVVVAWLLFEIAAITLTNLAAPASLLTTFIVLLGAGLLLSLIISWRFEATPDGLKRTENVPPDAVLPTWSRRKYAGFIITVALLAAALSAYQLLWQKPPAAATTVASPESQQTPGP
jgi:hypothetical protein